MKALIVYDTRTGNTVKIAQAMAKALKCRAIKASDTNSSELKDYDVIGIGSGIYAWRHSGRILKLADSTEFAGKEVFIFSTSGMGGKWQHSSLRKRLKKARAWIIGEFACQGHDKFRPIRWLNLNKGHPDERDTENSRLFTENILRKTSQE